MNRIVLITTEGCAGCEIMKRIVSSAYLDAKIENVSFGCYDFKEVEVEHLVKDNNITDFPTTLFIKEGSVVDKIVGTCPYAEVMNKLKTCFVESE